MMRKCKRNNAWEARWMVILSGFLLLLQPSLRAQAPSRTQDTLTFACDSTSYTDYSRCTPKRLILPATLIGVGFIGMESGWLTELDREVQEELQEHFKRHCHLDDYTQYAPIVALYGLDLLGVKGRHDLIDQTMLLATSSALMEVTVASLKAITNVERPDGSTHNSFPSGHTATAFMGAELLRRQYHDVSPWIGIAGYTVAAGTGFFRMFNNRHWFTDVIAGAGIGILSVEVAYWLHPFITKTLFPKRYMRNIGLVPYIHSQERGMACRIVF